MIQEEKLKEAKRLYEIANADQKYVLERLFPELKKSEDEKIRKAILELVRQSYPILEKKNQEQMIAWLEKQEGNHITKPQSSWKPSDEQMDALNDVISSRYIKYDVLSELWNDLKKLKEE